MSQNSQEIRLIESFFVKLRASGCSFPKKKDTIAAVLLYVLQKLNKCLCESHFVSVDPLPLQSQQTISIQKVSHATIQRRNI